jgi:hypothetical protein
VAPDAVEIACWISCLDSVSMPLWSRNMLSLMAPRTFSMSSSGIFWSFSCATTGAKSKLAKVTSRARLASDSGCMSGGRIGIGESFQFQKRVRSIFSAAFAWPSTASAKTPPLGSATFDFGTPVVPRLTKVLRKPASSVGQRKAT